MIEGVPEAWRKVLAETADGADAPDARGATNVATAGLDAFLAAERARADTAVYPALDDVFHALRLTAPDEVRAVILGQDPYHGPGEAHGLAFSVRTGTRVPPSLRNILLEWSDDLGHGAPSDPSLEAWARHGVLLLNTVLTVRRAEPNSHRGRGWEPFTDSVIRAVAGRPDPVAFLLWGAHAQARRHLIDDRHIVVTSNHPSPLSATRPPVPFRGSRPFSTVNARLAELGLAPIDWTLADNT
ncbi:MAG: uracil-DNA glycosylase [Chloroflexota bacterium]|jgi:uracil-DNA glycosylase|nr:uracil-DNA glycosylase [Chloroflexota bacterium]